MGASDAPHTSLRKEEGEEVEAAEAEQLREAQELATPDAQAALFSSQTQQQIEHLDLSSTGTEEGQQH